MASVRDIELRIRSVEGTKQITKAMKLVSTVKLQKAKNQVEQTRPYFEKTRETIGSILAATDSIDVPFMNSEREVKKKAYIVITSDRGLAGSYNLGICKLVAENIDRNSSCIVPVGKKARDFFKGRNYDIYKSYIGYTERPDFRQAGEIGSQLMEAYQAEEFDEVYLAYTHFKSTINHEPQLIKLFPLDASDFEGYGEESQDPMEKMTYEPDPEYVLSKIIPKYVDSIIYGALVESSASEQGARMTAMDSATGNADEMIEKLTLAKNRARQSAITQELAEIVGGAAAQE